MEIVDHMSEDLSDLSFKPCAGSQASLGDCPCAFNLPQFQSYHALNFSNSSEASFLRSKKFINSDFYQPQTPTKRLSREISSLSHAHAKQKFSPTVAPLEILITEMSEDSEIFNKKINVSRIEDSVIGQNFDTISDNYNESEKAPIYSRVLAKSIYDKLSVNIEKKVESNLGCQDVLMRSPSLRENLSESIRQLNMYEILDFYQAFNYYSSLEFPKTKDRRFWKLNFFQKICRCLIKEEEIDQQYLEACEKIVNFAYTPFNKSLIFHRNLLISAQYLIIDSKTLPSDFEFFFNTCLGKVNCKTQGILLVFLNTVFLSAFFPEVLKKFKETVPESEIFPVFCKLSKMNIDFLRRKRMNILFTRSQKCLEVIFFVFAGLCINYLALAQIKKTRVLAKLRKAAEVGLVDILSMSQRVYIDHSSY